MEKSWGYCKNKTENQRQEAWVQNLRTPENSWLQGTLINKRSSKSLHIYAETNHHPKGWEAAGGSGWGTHVNPWLIQVNVWQKRLQYCKVISLQLIKINKNKWKKLKNKCYKKINTISGHYVVEMNCYYLLKNNSCIFYFKMFTFEQLC